MRSFDEKFTDHIRNVFDQYHEEVDPAAFSLMHEKLKAQKSAKTTILYNRLMAAALVLIMLSGIFYWISPNGQFTTHTDQPLASNDSPSESSFSPIDSLNSSSDSIDDDPMSSSDSQILNIDPNTNAVAKNETKNDAQLNSGRESLEVSRSDDADSQLLVRSNLDNIDSDNLTLKDFGTSKLKQQALESNHLLHIGISEDDYLFRENFRQIGQHSQQFLTVRDIISNKNEKDSISQKLQETDDLVANSNYVIPKDASPYLSSAKQITQFLVGSMANYTSDQVAQGAGYFAGIEHYWKINETFSISTGGLLTVNQLQYSVKEATLGVPLTVGEISTASDGDVLNVNVGQDYEIRYTAIDIPLNTKWVLGSRGNGSYNFTIGLSSLFYLQQSMIERGTNYNGIATIDSESGDVNINFTSSDYEHNENSEAFDTVDLAKLMNVSVGYASINSDNKFEIELYIKYPIGDITSRNLSIGMGGLTVKYRL